MKKNIKCHICNVSNKGKNSGPEVTECKCCGTDLIHPESETLQQSILCSYAKKKKFNVDWEVDGTLFLTTKRLIWVKNNRSIMAAAGGALGVLIESMFNKSVGQVEVDFTLDNIEQLEHLEKGIKGFRKGIIIHTNNGETYQFMSSKLKTVEDTLSAYIT